MEIATRVDNHYKEIRDRNARDDYVRMEGHASGLTEGLAVGEDRMNRLILSLIQAGRRRILKKQQRIRSIGIGCMRNMG